MPDPMAEKGNYFGRRLFCAPISKCKRDGEWEMSNFDPDKACSGEGLFGLPSMERPAVAIIAVPWEATVTYGRGTAAAPEAIEHASQQVDVFDLEYGPIWKSGIDWLGKPDEHATWHAQACALARPVVEAGDVGSDPALKALAQRVDELANQRDEYVHQLAASAFDDGQIPAVLGGDHSSPLGLIRAAAERYPGLGILHIDAHADLHEAYMGFRSSHASIMARVLECPGVHRLVGVGYRDLCQGEWDRIEMDTERISVYTDPDLAMRLAEGEHWLNIVEQIVEELPPMLHISFDIDGLDPSLCPNTGTPVPGGLGFRDVQILLRTVAKHRQVVSFDLCEVSPGHSDEWDANVGARLLYKLSGCALSSRSRQ